MALRDELARKVARKNQEIAGLEQQAAALTQQASVERAYVRGLEETLKLLEREAAMGNQLTDEAPSLRKGSNPAKAYKLLKNTGHPLHIKRILEGIGRPVNRVNRSTMSAGLSAYVRNGELFTRPAPNTFGLLEWGDTGNANLANSGSDEATDEGESSPGDGPLMRVAARGH